MSRWRGNESTVVDEELVENTFVDAKIEPKVVMDLSIFKTKSLEKIIEENLQWLFVGCPRRGPLLETQYQVE